MNSIQKAKRVDKLMMKLRNKAEEKKPKQKMTMDELDRSNPGYIGKVPATDIKNVGKWKFISGKER